MMIRPYRINLGTTSGHLESENFVDCPCKRHHRSTLVFSPLCFASRGSPVRSRPRPPNAFIAQDLLDSPLTCSPPCTRAVQNRADWSNCAPILRALVANQL